MKVAELPPDEMVLVCRCGMEKPETCVSIYATEDAGVQFMCEDEHTLDQMALIHAGHLLEHYPHLALLTQDVPVGSMAYYFRDEGRWEVAEMLEPGDETEG